MKSPLNHLLPDPEDITDEAAAMLTEVLFRLAGACDLRYQGKIMRYQDRMKQMAKDDDPQ